MTDRDGRRLSALTNWLRAHPRATKRTLASILATGAAVAAALPAAALSSTGRRSPVLPAAGSTSTSVRLTQIGSSAEALATWTYPVIAPPAQESTHLHLFRSFGAALAPVTTVGCAAGCTSYQFFNLVPGARYVVKLDFAEMNLLDDLIWLPEHATAALTLRSTCRSGVCVSVDGRHPIGPADHAGQGLLHGAYVGPDQMFLASLGVTMHRGAVPDDSYGLDWEEWAAGNRLHWATTLVISDAWSIANHGNPPAPLAAELPAYRRWLTGYVKQILASGQRVDYFEPYNEPDLDYYSPAVAPMVTAGDLYKLFLVTYQVIKSLDPSAQVIGPSLGEWVEQPVSGYEAGMNMVDFLNFAAGNGIKLAAISFHEISTEQPRRMVEDVSEARRLLVRYPQLGRPKVFVNEYGDENTQRSPGWDTNYLAAITDSGVDLAGRTCFEQDCFKPDLDGLLTSDGTKPLPDYWVRSFYASMAGRMLDTSSSEDSVRAVASFDGISTLRILVGRGVGCTDTARCQGMGRPARPVPVTTSVTLPWTSGPVQVTATDISGAHIRPYGQPSPRVSVTEAVPLNGVLTLAVPAFADGDAWAYTIERG